MWVKKTEKEIIIETKEAERKINEPIYWRGMKITPMIEFIFIFAIAFFLLLLFFIVLAVTFGERLGRMPFLPGTSDVIRVPLSDIPQILPSYLFASSITGFVIAIVIFIFGRAQVSDKRKGWNPVTTQICQKCFITKADDGIYICDCGGEYILITKMKWVEPEESA